MRKKHVFILVKIWQFFIFAPFYAPKASSLKEFSWCFERPFSCFARKIKEHQRLLLVADFEKTQSYSRTYQCLGPLGNCGTIHVFYDKLQAKDKDKFDNKFKNFRKRCRMIVEKKGAYCGCNTGFKIMFPKNI